MRVERLVLGALQTNCWLVSDDAGGPELGNVVHASLEAIETHPDGPPVVGPRVADELTARAEELTAAYKSSELFAEASAAEA